MIARGRQYGIGRHGVVQLDAKPYCYDKQYALVYNAPKYLRGSLELQALRYGFMVGAIGRQPKHILDIGYGNGAFMLFAAGAGADVLGYDVTGLQIPGCRLLSSIDDAEAVTAVTMWDVLEHLGTADFLLRLKTEWLFVTVPYCHFPASRDLSWFSDYPHLKPDEHVRHFDLASLSRYLYDHGYAVVASSSHEDIVRVSSHGLPNTLTVAARINR